MMGPNPLTPALSPTGEREKKVPREPWQGIPYMKGNGLPPARTRAWIKA